MWLLSSFTSLRCEVTAQSLALGAGQLSSARAALNANSHAAASNGRLQASGLDSGLQLSQLALWWTARAPHSIDGEHCRWTSDMQLKEQLKWDLAPQIADLKYMFYNPSCH